MYHLILGQLTICGVHVNGWDVQPDGVRSVTNAAIDAATPMLDAISALSDHIYAAVEGAQSASINQALIDYLDVEQTHVTMIEQRIPNAISGVIGAVSAINDGDVEMATESQALASKIVLPSLLRGLE
jgi:hypothetical protein